MVSLTLCHFFGLPCTRENISHSKKCQSI